MRLLERVLIDVIGRYVPDVDLQKLKVDLLHQRANLSSVNLAPDGHVAPTVFLAGLPFTLVAPSTLKSLDVWFDSGRLRANGAGLHLRLVHIPYNRCAGNCAVNDALERAKRASLAEAERQATGIFGKLLNNLLPLLMQKVQFVMTDVRVSVEFGGKHVFHVFIDRLQTTSVDYTPLSKYDAGGLHTGGPEDQSKGSSSSNTTATSSSADGPVVVAGDLAKDVLLEGVSLTLGRQSILSLLRCTLKLRYRLEEYGVELNVDDALKFLMTKVLSEALLALQRENKLWQVAAKYKRPRTSVSETPLEWWRFTVRMLMRSSGCGHWSADFGRSMLTRCVAYYNAHLERLSRGNRANAAVVETCLELEDVLDVETIIFVRSRARNKVRAQTANRFAAEDWLSWMFIGHQESSGKVDREMTKDIRDAVDSLEAAESEGLDSIDDFLVGMGLSQDDSFPVSKNSAAGPNDATSWTSATAFLRLESIVVSFVDEDDGSNLDVIIDNTRLYFELDSGFSTLTLGASVDALAVSDGRVNYIRHVGLEQGWKGSTSLSSKEGHISRVSRMTTLGMSAKTESTLLSSSRESLTTPSPILIVELQASPRSPEAEASLNVFIGSVVVHLDVASLSPIFATLSGFHSAMCGIEDNERHPDILPLLSTGGLQSEKDTDAKISKRVDSDSRSSSGNSSAALSRESFHTSAGSSSKLESQWFENLVFSIRCERFHVYFSSGLAVRDEDCLLRDAFSVDLSRVLCVWSPFKNDPGREFNGACTVEWRSCVMANDLALSSGENSGDEDDTKSENWDCASSLDKDGFVRIVHRNEPCLLVDRLALSVTTESTLEVRCGDTAYLHLRETELESSVYLTRKVWEELQSELQVQEFRGDHRVAPALTGPQKIFSPPFTPSAWNRSNLQRRRAHRVEKDSGVVRVLGNAFFVYIFLENSGRHPLITLSVKQLCVENGLVSPGSLTVSAHSVIAADAHGEADIAIAPADGKSHVGLRLASQSHVSPSYSGAASRPRTEIKLGKVELISTADRVRSLSAALFRILLIFRVQPLEELSADSDAIVVPVLANPHEDVVSFGKAHSSNSVDTSEFGEANASVQASQDLSCETVRIKIGIGESVLTLVGTGLVVKNELGQWDVHVEGVEMTEYSTTDGSETQFISSRKEAPVMEPSTPRVRVSCDGNKIRIFLTSMKLVVFKPSLERTVALLGDLVRDAGAEWSSTMEPGDGTFTANDSDRAFTSNSETGNQFWTISGKRVFVVLPQSKDGLLAIGLDLGEVTIVSAARRLHVSGRKAAILSTSRPSNNTKRKPSLVWNRIVPALEIDIVRSVSSEIPIEGVLNHDQHHRDKDEWKIELGNTPTVLLTVQRARLVLAVLAENLLAPSESDNAARTDGMVVDDVSGGLEVSSPAGIRYDRTVVNAVASGLAFELFESDESADGVNRKALALIGIGPVRFFFDTVSEKPLQSCNQTQVTVLFLDIAWLRVHDRQVDVHDMFRLVLCVEAGDPVDPSDLLEFVPCVHLAFHEKRSGEDSVEAKVSARITHPLILLQPELFVSIANFFSSCWGNEVELSASDLDYVDVDEHGRGDGNRTCRKTSVVVVSPRVFIAEAPLSNSSRGLELCAEELKVSLRQNLRGMFTRGTQIRVRGLELSVSPPEVLTHHSTLRAEAMHPVPADMVASPDSRESLPCQSLGSTKGRSISALKVWSLDSDAPVVLLRMLSLQCRLATIESSAIYVTVPTVVFDATVRDFSSLFSLLGRLHLPEVDDIVSTTRNIDSKTSPPIDVRFLDIECILRIPQHRLQGTNFRYGGDGSSVVRAKLGLDVFSRGSSLDSTLCVFAIRSYDGQSGIWDRRELLEDCQVALTYCWTNVPSIVCKISRVRLNLSPLIVKTLCNLFYSFEAALSEDVNSRRDSSHAPKTDEPGPRQSPLKLDVGVQGIEVFFLSEQLRVRAIVSDLRAQLSLPSNTRQIQSELKLYVGNFTVHNEVPGSRGNGVRDWSILVAKTLEVPEVSIRGSSASGNEPLLLLCESSFSSMARSRLRSGRRTAADDVSTESRVVKTKSGHSTRQREDDSRPLLKLVLRFGGRGDDEALAAVLMAGLDVCVDVDVVSELVAWGNMAMDAVATAKSLHRDGSRRPRVQPEVLTERRGNVEVSHVNRHGSRHGRIVIGSSGLRLSARAPSSAQASARTFSVRRVAEFVLGSESVSGLTVALPMRSISFDFASSEDVAKAVASDCRALVFSRGTLSQILRQSPSVLSLGRVGMLAYLRRADSPQRLARQTASRRVEGLLEAADVGNAEWNRKHCIRERVSTLDLSSASRLRGETRMHAEVIGMGGDADLDVVADGASLFQLLIRRDSRLRALGDKYSFFAVLDDSKSLMVTDKHILLVSYGASVPVVERRLPISSIERYSVSTRNSSVLLVHFSTGGLGARQFSSDMLSQFQARARAVMPLELKCGDESKAESLSRWLPSARKRRRNLDLPDVGLDLPIFE